jgi:hypothetical protein
MSFNWGGTTGTGGSAATFYIHTAPCHLQHVPQGAVVVPVDFLRDALRLAHPDLHSKARLELATKVSQYITAQLAALK